ncbi:hypothetical protein Nepgr_026681 [Nepenthes gracilis]|uniref:Glycosyltransferase n=1 Tax=Nepenthes gracilis TaxID=150966 RepID=A0AAD3Y0T1_NEPGR|nr:hypothetical protein Nepgr_026681 [Nepenthes gracilis]
MRRAELIFFPMPGLGHLVPAVETSRRLAQRDETVSITLFIVRLPTDNQVNPYIQSLNAAGESGIGKRIKLLELPDLENPIDRSSRRFMELVVEGYKPMVKKMIQDIVVRSELSLSHPEAGQLASGLVVDFFCTGMIDVARELGIPCYVLFTSAASTLSHLLHFQSLRDDHGSDVTEFGKDPDAELDLPAFGNRLPAKLVPQLLLDKSKEGGSHALLNHARRYRETNGIIVNAYTELETRAIHSLSNDPAVPPIYPIGPILSFNTHSDGGAGGSKGDADSILRWLDDQPQSSVVFLCFGSAGSFGEDQVTEVANAVERSGHRFLWSLRLTRDDLRIEDALPNGFLDRTAGIGRVIGWAPQVAILSRAAVGGFVSHCGWNSTLESLWYGVPIAAWPMYAEQQLNAFMLVRELGLAVEIKMDHKWDPRTKLSNCLVTAEEIERGIRMVMEMENGVRIKMKEASERSRKAVMERGSSYNFLGRFLEDVFKNYLK